METLDCVKMAIGWSRQGRLDLLAEGLMKSITLLLVSLLVAQAADLETITDEPYKPEGETAYERERCLLDWYLPKDTPGFPTLVWFHGGGLQNGDKADAIATGLAHRFAGEGIAVVSVNYRLSPKASFPAYIEDAAAAVAHVRKHVGERGGADDLVFVSGHSAGGYLTSMLGVDARYLQAHGLGDDAIAGYLPVSGQMITHSTVRGERGIARTQPIIDEGAPSYHARSGAAPFFCIAGTEDLPARAEENRYFVAALEAAGHPWARLKVYEGRDHTTIASRLSQKSDVVAVDMKAFMLEVGARRAFPNLRKPDHVVNLWPGRPPGPERVLEAEQDMTKDSDRLIAGRRIIKLGNVSVPQAHVFLPPVEKRTGASVVICPGGGFHILAWDLEGVEVAEWLNGLGIAAVVLKYRVPTAAQNPRWLAPAQDAQRTLSLVRHHAPEWQLDPDRVAILGFSAGGATAWKTTLAEKRHYEAIDAVDEASCRPDRVVLIYGAGLPEDSDATAVRLPEAMPPVFMAHAFDDFVPVAGTANVLLALKQAEVPSELHVYDAGGHGYGLRLVDDLPVTTWIDPCAAWLRRAGWWGKE